MSALIAGNSVNKSSHRTAAMLTLHALGADDVMGCPADSQYLDISCIAQRKEQGGLFLLDVMFMVATMNEPVNRDGDRVPYYFSMPAHSLRT